MENPINPGNHKLLIFTAFSDTAEYLYEHVSTFVKERYHLHSALVTGSIEGRTTIPKFKADLNNVLTCFSPLSKDKASLMPDSPEIDILIATDCISEGQNLQDCDCVVNYDIHWNPVRLVPVSYTHLCACPAVRVSSIRTVWNTQRTTLTDCSSSVITIISSFVPAGI